MSAPLSMTKEVQDKFLNTTLRQQQLDGMKLILEKIKLLVSSKIGVSQDYHETTVNNSMRNIFVILFAG